MTANAGRDHAIAAAMTEVRGAKIEDTPTSIEAFRGKLEAEHKLSPSLVQHLVEVAHNYRDGIFAAPMTSSRPSRAHPRSPSRRTSQSIERH